MFNVFPTFTFVNDPKTRKTEFVAHINTIGGDMLLAGGKTLDDARRGLTRLLNQLSADYFPPFLVNTEAVYAMACAVQPNWVAK